MEAKMAGSDDNNNKGEKKFQKSYFDVLGLCCSSEVPLIEKILRPLEGVKDVSVIVPSRTVIVVHDDLLISQLQIVKALNQARLEANVRLKGEINYKKRWPSPYAVVCGVLLSLYFLKYVWQPFQWMALAAVAVGACPIVMRSVVAIRNITIDINILALIAVVGSVVLKDYWEAGTIVFLFTIAEWLESRASHKATAVMSSLMNIAPQKAVLADSEEEVDVDKVKLDTVLAIKAGEIIPIDGIVVDGKCEVDEKALTGESVPVAKQKESTVWAGTINIDGYITVRTTALADDCVVARMAKLVEEAQNNKSRTQRLIDKCAKFYTPAVVAISFCLALIPVALRVPNQNQWIHLALVVLVSACPCALVLSTPVATSCALSKAATSGLLIKGGEFLEILAKIKIMAFDKTGTITRGEFMVVDFRSLLDDVSLDTLIYWVSSIESRSSHPMAAALVDYAQSHSVESEPDKVEEFQNFPGEGIYGKIDGKDIYVGNQKIATRAGCGKVPSLEGINKEGKSIGYIFSGPSLAGIFTLSDACRTGVKEAMRELTRMGIKTAMLTGDCQAAARHAQDQLEGILDVVHAELLPQDKARIIKDFQKEAPTAMIGDGLNDAPALATADIGISMGISGSPLATETGHMILMSNDIRKIPKAARLARKARRKIIENVILSATTKGAILALAIAGYPLVWAAVLADAGTCLLVIFNSMLLLQGTPAHGRNSVKSSAAPHVHKGGCKTTGSHSLHTHQPCCSNIEARKTCQPQACSTNACASGCQLGSYGLSSSENNKCSDSKEKLGCCGSNSLENNKCSNSDDKQNCCGSNKFENKKFSDSADKHGCCAHTIKINKARHLDHVSCERVTQDIGSHNVHNHGCSGHSNCCEEDKCRNSIEKQGDCVAGAGLQEGKKHCEQGKHSADHCASGNTHNHLNCSADHLKDQPMTSTKHCHPNQCISNHARNLISDEQVGNMLKFCCKHAQVHYWGKRHCAEYHALDSSIASSSAMNHVDCAAIRTCESLGKRQIGGCCESFRKECCSKSGHFGTGFGSGLSEIVIE